MTMIANPDSRFPPVALWRINAIRFIFLLMALIMGSAVWYQLLTEWAAMDINRGLAKSMLAALALMSLLGVRYPLQMHNRSLSAAIGQADMIGPMDDVEHHRSRTQIERNAHPRLSGRHAHQPGGAGDAP